MIHAYDKSYLAGVQKRLGRMLDYLVNDCLYPIETAWQWFLASDLAIRLAHGDCAAAAGSSGIELAYAVLEQAGVGKQPAMPCFFPERTPEYWTGWAVAYYQWDTGMSFSEIEAVIPIDEIRKQYNPYHEMDIRQFTDHMDALYRNRKPHTNLKIMRSLAGLSQKELANRSGIPVRTIQQYEQRRKDINKAQAETLLCLSRILLCTTEDLMEKVPVAAACEK